MWKMGESAVLGKPSLYTSRITDVYSPDMAVWMDDSGQIQVLGLDGEEVPKGWRSGLKVKEVEDGWKDPDFPHNNDSIGTKAEGKYEENRWLRALSLHARPTLFADVEPSDACQGIVDNCWLMSAMCAVAEFPSYIKNNLFVTKKAQRFWK